MVRFRFFYGCLMESNQLWLAFLARGLFVDSSRGSWLQLLRLWLFSPVRGFVSSIRGLAPALHGYHSLIRG